MWYGMPHNHNHTGRGSKNYHYPWRQSFDITSTNDQSMLDHLTIDDPSTITSNNRSSDDLNLPQRDNNKRRFKIPKRIDLNIRPLYTNIYEGTPQIREAWEDKLILYYANPPTKCFIPKYQLKADTDKMFEDKVDASEQRKKDYSGWI